MAFNPYFRYGATSLDLLGIQAPTFPMRIGEKQHSYLTEKNKYAITTRNYGSTEVSLRTENIQKSDRDTIWSFWDTTLSKGYNPMTVIDHKGRMLFEAFISNSHQQWRKERGGLYNIDYDIQSSLTWTPPCWGCFPTTTNSLVNHNLSGDDLTLDDGVLVDYGTDNNVLRQTGYALKMTGTAGTDTGASNSSLSWKSKYAYNSFSMFCQIRAGEVANNLHIIQVADASGNNKVTLKLAADNASQNDLAGIIVNDSDISYVTKADTAWANIPVDTWYDIAFAYDGVTNATRVYYAPSAESSFTRFLYGETNIEEGIMSTISDPYYPPNIIWTECTLLKEDSASDVSINNYYVQNAFIFDGFLSAQEFNTLRRLCYCWNTKTTGNHPQ